MTNGYLLLIVQFVGLNTMYFPDDGSQVVPKHVGNFVFIYFFNFSAFNL
jgi:hypothetical protein